MKKYAFSRAVAVVFVLILRMGAQAADIDFDKEVRPILELNCVKCHGAEQQKGKLRLDTKDAAIQGGNNGTVLVVGKPQESKMYTSTILASDHDDVMPPKKEEKLTKAQTETFRLWIEQGAKWPAGASLAAIKKIDFVKDVQPIIEYNCVSCHHQDYAKGGLRLDEKEEAFKPSDSGVAIVPGDKMKSLLYASVTASPDDDKIMPPKKKAGPLDKESIETLGAWIQQGAHWPDGVKCIQKKKEEAPGANEALTVADIHKLVLSRMETTTEAGMKKYTNTIPGSRVKFTMVPIPGGEYMMGSPASEKGRGEDEGPQHKVKISPFWMGACEVTWDEFEMFMYPDEERKFKGEIATEAAVDKISDAVSRPTKPYVEMSFGMGKDGYPAISMTQHSANKYCEWLSAKTGQYFRLPTEAEWEYACRARTKTAYSFGDDASQLGDYAWYEKNSKYKYQKVGMKKPNPWGLYDMHGNVAEWVIDQYEPNYEQVSTIELDPWVKATKPYPHVVRGGSWDDSPELLRSAVRQASDKSWKMQDPQLPKSIWYHTDAKFLGFRVVRPLKVPPPEELSKYWTSGVEKE